MCEIPSETTLLHHLYAVGLGIVYHATTFLLANLPCKYSNRLTSAQHQLECSGTPSKKEVIKFSENREEGKNYLQPIVNSLNTCMVTLINLSSLIPLWHQKSRLKYFPFLSIKLTGYIPVLPEFYVL